MDELRYAILRGEIEEGMTPQESIRHHNQLIYDLMREIEPLLDNQQLDDENQKRYDALNTKLKRLLLNKINYRAFHPALNMGFAEWWGERLTQEDRVCVGEISDFAELSDDERYFALKKLALTLQATIEHKGMGQQQGSTLCAIILVGDVLYTINIGDSTAYLIPTQPERKSIRLNTDLHHPQTVKEQARLAKAKKEVINGRIAGVLAISHAIGDNDYEEAGLSHEADIYSHHLEGEMKNAFIVLACDGLTEDKALTMKKIKEIVTNHKSKSPDAIAEILARKAYEAGSQDNISVVVIPIDHEVHENQTHSARFAAIFDGHGGDQVADTLASIFTMTLKFITTCTLITR